MSFFKRKSVPNDPVDEIKKDTSNKRPKVVDANNNQNEQLGGKTAIKGGKFARIGKTPWISGKSVHYECDNSHEDNSDDSDELDEENNNILGSVDILNIDILNEGGVNRKEYEKNEAFLISVLKNENSRNWAEAIELLESGIFMNLDLEGACQHPRITRKLLELVAKNSNPINDANNLLKKIISNDGIDEDDRLDIIRYLVETYNVSKLNALTHVCLSKKTTLETIKYLMDTTDLQIMLRASEFLHEMSRNGKINLDIIQYFVDTHKVNLNAVIYDGKNLLHWALNCETVDLCVIKYLIENGVDLKKKDAFKMTPFHQLLENLLKNSGQLNQEIIKIINYLSEQNFDAEAMGGSNGYTILQYVCHMQIDPKAVYNVINKSSDDTMKSGRVTRPLGVACRANNIIAAILLLLDGRNLGLNVKRFNIEIESYFKKYIEGTDLDEKACAEQIRGLITAAKKSRVTLKTEVSRLPMECLINLPAEHLMHLTANGCLPKDCLLELKEQKFFSLENVKYFSKDDREKVLTFFCCIKRINNNRLKEKINGKLNKIQLPFIIPKPVVIEKIAPQIFYNAAVTASENKNKSKPKITSKNPATFKK